MGQALLIACLSAAASFIGAWLAANFALRRFYKERMWERKAAAYSAIFEALHVIERWYDKHHDAYFEQRDLPEETTNKLRADANAAEDQLERRLASETWLLPDSCRKCLADMTSELKKRDQDWFTYIDTGVGTIRKATSELRQLVRSDLGIK
jgi:hypothetical protein